VRTCAASPIPAVLGRRNPCERRLLRIRAANGARYVVVTSWEAYIASSSGDDARNAYVAAATHSDATGPSVFEERSLLLQRGDRDAIFLAFPCI